MAMLLWEVANKRGEKRWPWPRFPQERLAMQRAWPSRSFFHLSFHLSLSLWCILPQTESAASLQERHYIGPDGSKSAKPLKPKIHLYDLDLLSTPNMTGQRFHRTTEVMPRRPWKSKSSFASRPIKISENTGTQRVRARYDEVLPPFISIVRSPGRTIILVPDMIPTSIPEQNFGLECFPVRTGSMRGLDAWCLASICKRFWKHNFCLLPVRFVLTLLWTHAELPCNRKCYHYNNYYFLEIISALHYILRTRKYFQQN